MKPNPSHFGVCQQPVEELAQVAWINLCADRSLKEPAFQEQLPSLPVQPILQQDCEPWAMYDHIKRYPWVLELYRYAKLDEFIPRLREVVISPAEKKVMEIRKKD